MSKEKKSGRVKGFFKDFKTFITKGNILDLAIAVVIGGAFGKIVSSLVDDIIMPLISLAVKGKSVADWKYVIKKAVYDADGILKTAESAIYYGNFIQTIIDFLIIAFFIFIALRTVMSLKNNMKRQEDGEVVFDKKQKKQMIKSLKTEGKTKAEALNIIAKKEEEATAEKKAALLAKQAEEEANKPASTQELLVQIRDLLANKTNE